MEIFLHRLDCQSMQKKYIYIFLLIFVPLTVLPAVLLSYSYTQETDKEDALELHRDHSSTKLISSIITSELKGLSSDVLFLAELFKDYSVNDDLQDITENLRLFAAHRGIYDQIRYLNYDGMEKIRINYDHGEAAVTAQDKLQNKSDRYYFSETILHDKGDVFLSSFDLNIENGAIEQPIKPVLRIATHLYNEAGDELGVIVLNYLGYRLLSKIIRSSRDTGRQLMLLNNQGYWLMGGGTHNWDFMFPEKQQTTFGNAYPDVWKRLLNLPDGQTTSDDGMFTWISVSPWKHIQSLNYGSVDMETMEQMQTWRIVTHRDASFIKAKRLSLQTSYQQIFLLMLIILGSFSAVVAHLKVKQGEGREKREMLQETQELSNALLKTALASTQSMEEEMSDALRHILNCSWLSVMAKGSIFLLDEKNDELVMVAQQGLAKPLLSSCARLPVGKCLCGKAAETRKIVFSNCLDNRHEITFEGISEHGHICVPILKDEKLLGVLNLYVEHGHKYHPLYDDMFKLICNVLITIIERQHLDDDLRAAHEEVKTNHDELAFERSIVEETLLRIRSAENFDAEGIRYLLAPVENTAGDIILSARRPDGMRHIMVGDFTGHGLPSALGGPTVADTFYAMTAKGISPVDILTEINNKLIEKLPPHIFLAASFIEFDQDANRLSLWNASQPDVILFHADGSTEYHKSKLMALGITEEMSFADAETVIELKPGDHLYTYTDGIVEAANEDDEMFGRDRFEALLSEIIAEDKGLDTVIDVLSDYEAGDEQADDITMLEISV